MDPDPGVHPTRSMFRRGDRREKSFASTSLSLYVLDVVPLVDRRMDRIGLLLHLYSDVRHTPTQEIRSVTSVCTSTGMIGDEGR